MSKYTAPSDRDYQDEVEGRTHWARATDPPSQAMAVICPACGACFETNPDQPAETCRGCEALAALTDLRNQTRGAA